MKLAFEANPGFSAACEKAGIRPEAINWERLLGFVEKLLPFILAMFAKSEKLAALDWAKVWDFVVKFLPVLLDLLVPQKDPNPDGPTT
jgi:hypothetical protein